MCFALLLLVLWTVSQVVAAIPGLPNAVRGILIKSKVLVGPLALALIALTNIKDLELKPAFKLLGVFVLYSVFSLLVRAEPNWQRAVMIAAWAGCFWIIPASLNTAHRIREFIRLTFPAMLGSLILAIVIALLTGDVTESNSGRTRYHFGMNPNYFAVLTATVSYAGFSALLLVPSINRTLCWVAIIGGFILTLLTDCRTQLLMLGASFAIYGAYSQRRLIAGLCQLMLTSGILLVTSSLLLLGTPLLSVERANDFSSGRVLLWYSLVKSNLGSGEMLPLLWGQSDLKFDTGLAGWRALGHMKQDAFDRNLENTAIFRRVAFDNAYLDTLLMTGAIGLVLAIWGWWHWWRALKPSSSDTLETRRSKGLARGVLGGMLITGVFASSWPAIGNVSISFGMVLAVALTVATRDTPPAQATESAPVHAWNPPGRIR